MYYADKTGNHNFGEDQDNWEYLISQLDGQTDIELSEEEEIVIKKNVFAVNCVISEISYLVNFFRSFDFLWRSTLNHCLCESDKKQSKETCFFLPYEKFLLKIKHPQSKRTQKPKNYRTYFSTWSISEPVRLGLEKKCYWDRKINGMHTETSWCQWK